MKIINNMLNQKDFYDIKQYIYNLYDNLNTIKIDGNVCYERKDNIKYHETGMGRILIQIKNPDFPQEILKKFDNVAKEFKEDFLLNSISFLKYSADYGIPKLGPHVDDHEFSLSIDLQLKSNTSYPMVIEDQEFDLKDNDALCFNSAAQVHWRKPKNFKNGEFVDALLLHYYSPSYVPLNKNNKKDKESYYKEKYIKEKNQLS